MLAETGRGHRHGGIEELQQLRLEHDLELRLDLAPYNLTPEDLGGRLPWRAAVDLARKLQDTPGTWLHAAENQWTYPASWRDLALYAVTVSLGGAGWPLPWQARQEAATQAELAEYQQITSIR